MIRKHVAMLRILSSPTAFLEAQRVGNVKRYVLVENWHVMKLTIEQDTLTKWLNQDFVRRSCHTAESYILGETGRQIIAQFNKRETTWQRADMREAARREAGR